MAIIGGAGNPVGGSFTGPAESLELVGDQTGEHKFGYAYSGIVPVAPTDTTMLKFTTGNYLLVGTIQFLYASQADAAPGDDVFYEMKMNGTSILSYIETGYGSSSSRSPHDPINIVIPPYTEIEVISQMGSSNTINQCALITGRIYR